MGWDGMKNFLKWDGMGWDEIFLKWDGMGWDEKANGMGLVWDIHTCLKWDGPI